MATPRRETWFVSGHDFSCAEKALYKVGLQPLAFSWFKENFSVGRTLPGAKAFSELAWSLRGQRSVNVGSGGSLRIYAGRKARFSAELKCSFPLLKQGASETNSAGRKIFGNYFAAAVSAGFCT
jgi:hypothetical protein